MIESGNKTNINDFIARKAREGAQVTQGAPKQEQGEKRSTRADKSSRFEDESQKRREQVNAMALDVYQNVWKDEEQFTRLLDIMERFTRENGSLGGGAVNAALIYAQMPDAEYIQTGNTWMDQGFRLKPGDNGEKSQTSKMMLFVPPKRRTARDHNAMVMKVFDVSQVNVNQKFWDKVHEQEGTPPSPDTLVTAMVDGAPFTVAYEELPDGYDSVYVKDLDRILLRETSSIQAVAFNIIVELGHRELAKAPEYSRTHENEFIAYSAAYVCARRYGLNLSDNVFPKESFPESIDSPGKIKETVSKIHKTFKSVSQEIDVSIVRLAEKDARELDDLEEPDL